VPLTPHTETHFTGGDAVRDIVIGMADGLTVPFALAAGLSGAISQAHLIVTAGLAEIAAGSIAMGLGGYLAARSNAEHFASEQRREEREITETPDAEEDEVREVFERYGLTREESAGVIASLRRRPRDWVAFMMRFELGLEPPQPGRAWKSALTIAGAYVVGGLIPLAAYIATDEVDLALRISTSVTLVALALFGAVKARFSGAPVLRGAVQTTLIGGVAAGAAFAIARALA